MHILSHQNRSEFLACPQLIRFEYGEGRDGFEPTLLIKGNTLLLKYIVLGVPMQLAFAMCEGRLLYALKVFDDGEDGGILWSIAEGEQELKGIRGLARGETLVAFLFNEAVVNVAWNDWPALKRPEDLSAWADTAELGPIDHAEYRGVAKGLLEQLHSTAKSNGEWLVLDIGNRSDWESIRNFHITNKNQSSLIDLFSTNEGNQQEQIGVWLTDSLNFSENIIGRRSIRAIKLEN